MKLKLFRDAELEMEIRLGMFRKNLRNNALSI